MHNPLAAKWFSTTRVTAANWLVMIVSSAIAIGSTVRAAIVGGDDWERLVIIIPLCTLCAIATVRNLTQSEKRKWTEAATPPPGTDDQTKAT